MCGLFGMAGNLSYRDKEFLRYLAIVSTFRGEDSTGLVLPNAGGGEPQTMKTLGTPFDLFELSAFDKLSLHTKAAAIGHTRKATVGGITKAAAHPFTYGEFTGVHNGTLTNWRNLPCGAEITDSATLYKSFSEIGVRETIEQVDGAYALVWWDSKKNTLNFLRNGQRTLFYAFSEKYDKMIWASEPWMIWAAVSRADFDLADIRELGSETATTVQPVDKDVWWEIKISNSFREDAITFLSQEPLVGGVKKPEVKTYTPPFQGAIHSRGNAPRTGGQASVPAQQPSQSAKAVTASTAAASANTNSNTSPSTSLVTTDKTSSSETSSRSPRPTLSLVQTDKSNGSAESGDSKSALTDIILFDPNDPLNDDLRDLYGDVMSKEDFAKTDAKCSFCQVDIDYDDACASSRGDTTCIGVGRWLSRTQLLCTTCTPSL